MRQEENNYQPSLTGVRAIAAWLVFIHHFNFFKEAYFGRAVHVFFSETHIGVTVFFVLSGLLITLRYYDKAIDTRRAFYNYFVKRFARIYPAFFLILVINFIWILATRVYDNSFEGGWQYFMGAATLLRGFFANYAVALVPQSWSLTVEECFYISCPFIFLIIRKHRRALFILPLILVGVGLLVTFIFIRYPFHGFFASVRFLFNFTFFGRCIEFFAGIGTALLYKRLQPAKLKGFRCTIAGICLMTFCLAGLATLHSGDVYGDHHPLGIIINNLVLPAGIALLFWGLLTERNIISRLLGTGPMILLGKSSYIFYLVHVGFFATFFFTRVSHNPLLIFAYLNILSVLLYMYFEKPVNYWIRRRFIKEDVVISKI